MSVPKTILIVEDDADIRESLATVLGFEGFEPMVAKDGREALQFLLQAGATPPCLILLDMMMPRMNGWEFLEERKSLPDSLKGVPVVALSASRLRQSCPEMTVFLSKPVEVEMLMRVVHEHCGTVTP